MTRLIIIAMLATIVLLALKFVQWLIGIASISLFLAFSPIMLAIGAIVLMLVFELVIEIMKAALWKRK